MKKVLVWDAPVRLAHWTMALAFALAYITHDSEQWRLTHVTAGYSFFAVLMFRMLWGFIGTRHARFRSFWFRPGEVVAYLKSIGRGKAAHWTGHNPAGSYAIFAILAIGLITPITGFLTYQEIGGELMEEPHEFFGNLLLLLVGVHIAGVVLGSLLHRENLVRAMITGHKLGADADAITSTRLWTAFVLAILTTAATLWLRTL